jgi:hypothetical protein
MRIVSFGGTGPVTCTCQRMAPRATGVTTAWSSLPSALRHDVAATPRTNRHATDISFMRLWDSHSNPRAVRVRASLL